MRAKCSLVASICDDRRPWPVDSNDVLLPKCQPPPGLSLPFPEDTISSVGVFTATISQGPFVTLNGDRFQRIQCQH